MKKNPDFSPKLSNEFAASLQQSGAAPIIEISNLRLRTFIGINEWEQERKQDVILNIKIICVAEVGKSCISDDIKDAVNYKTITKKIISYVEEHRFYLLEKMVAGVLELIMQEAMVSEARVKAEKPGALSFSDSVGVSLTAKAAAKATNG